MARRLLRFHFKTPVHIGTHRSGYDRSEEVLHSDTLYSAIIQAWRALGIAHPLFELEVGAEAIPGSLPGFTLSSMFPFYWGQDEPLYFFPLPPGLLKHPNPVLAKKLRALRYADAALFAQLLRTGELDEIDSAVKGRFLTRHADFESSENQKFCQKHTISRNAVPQPFSGKEATDTEIFYMERISFHQHSGLFCLADIEEAAESELLAALSYLQDEGMGSDRHVGNGLFELQVDDWPNPIQELVDKSSHTPYRLNLSLFCPENEQQLTAMLPDNDSRIQYKLRKRGGWISSYPYLSYRKNAIYMFEEGSIFRFGELKAGQTVNLKPKTEALDIGHNIFRVGKSLFLPINLPNNES